MNSAFMTTSLDSAVATHPSPSAAIDASDAPDSHPTPESQPHPLDVEPVSAVPSIEKLEQHLVSAVDAHITPAATTSSPKRPRATDASAHHMRAVNHVVDASALPNGVENIDAEHTHHLANHVQVPLVVASPTSAEHAHAVTDAAAQSALPAITEAADQTPPLQLDTAVHTVALSVHPAAVHQQPSLSALMPAESTAHVIVNASELNADADTDAQPPTKKKRKTYNTEEERRQARILKNRRTAEESRQRRLKRMKELEQIAAKAELRESELMLEIRRGKEQLQQAVKLQTSLRAALEQKDVEIARRDAELVRKEAELLQRQEELERLHERLALKS